MRIAFYGASLLSSYRNGAATDYRGLLGDLAARGYEIHFYEPEPCDRQEQRGMDPPPWARLVLYPATASGLGEVVTAAAGAQIVVKSGGAGAFDDELLERVMSAAPVDALRVFWDVDAEATLRGIRNQPSHPLRRALPHLDLVLTRGGGDPVVRDYRALGARRCAPVHGGAQVDSLFREVAAHLRGRCAA